MKTVVLAEKPSVARDIAKVLKCNQKGDGFLASDKWIVTWAVGHLVSLMDPEAYAEEYKKWRYETLPIIPEEFKLTTDSKTVKQFKIVKNLFNSKDCKGIVVATDAGREGELIFRYIYQLSGCNKPFNRLWLSSLTEEAIMEGFRQLKDGKEFDSLADAAQCRSEADWLVGINATRGYSVRFGGYKNLLSIGRVQTPTLAILVQREEEILNFKPQPYWELIATFSHENGLYQGKWQKGEEDRFQTAESAKAILELITGKEGKITKAEKKERKQPAPFLYDLTELQREANKKFGFSAEKTLKVAQSLYETHKVLTYPRTSSRFLSTDMASQLKTMLMAVNQEPYKSFVEELVVLPKLPVSNRIINDKKVTDHHAIVPTTKRANLGKLSADERKIYDLVVKRFLAVFYPNALWQHTTILTVVEGEEFITKGKILVEAGWRKVYGAEVVEEEDEQDAVLPPVNKGDQVKVREGEVLEKLTKAPNRYTEAGLL